MRNLIYILILTFSLNIYAQDGSDIIYIQEKNIDSTLVGKYAHIDFGENSFGGRNIDSVKVLLGKSVTEFIENRNDDGYNNWFNEQSLKTADNHYEIKKCKITRVFDDMILVDLYIENNENNESDIFKDSNIFPVNFFREEIYGLLIKAD